MKLSSVAASALLIGALFAGSVASARSHKEADNRYGGPVYAGAPDLVTAGSLLSAGGGAKAYSTRIAFGTIIGPQLVDPELETLRREYGAAAVETWLHSFDFVVRRSAELATDGGVIFPLGSASHTGKALFVDVVHDGTDAGGTFWTGTMLDKLVSHAIHEQTMDDLDAMLGAEADASYHKITNQFIYDLAVQLGLGDDVKLSNDH